MINNYESLIIPLLISGITAIAVNIFYYKYRFKKEKGLEFLKMQITELLSPIYITFKNIEMYANAHIDDEYAFIEHLQKNKDIDEIIAKKLYLANPKLSILLLGFLNNKYLVDSGITRTQPENVIKNYEELRKAVFKEYEQKVKEYQRIFGQK